MNFVVKEKHTRSGLLEGRMYQMGFGFLKKEKNTLYTVQPISTCKDYLNDVVFSETTNKSISVYGLDYSKQDIFKKDEPRYLAIKILDYFKNNDKQLYNNYINYEKDKKRLRKTYKNIEKLLNYIEIKLGVDLTKIKPSKNDEDLFVVEVPPYWTSTTHHISLYALLLRIAQFYEDDKIEPQDYLNNLPTNQGQLQLDANLWNQAKAKLLLLLYGFEITQDFKKLETMDAGYIHNCGINAFNEIKF